MKYLNDQDLLAVWEFGVQHTAIETNLFLLSFAYPKYDANQIMSLSIGERDARLLHIREKLFGSVFQNTSECKACGQKIEWETHIDDLKLQGINEDETEKIIDLLYNQHKISFRLPNSKDVLEIIDQGVTNEQEQLLIQKCILKSTLPEDELENIKNDLKNKIIAKMEEYDPQANIVMSLNCTDCDNEWTSTFDIMKFLWVEINDWAIQMMQEIYLLASKFGWSENDILKMSRFRRNLFIKMING